MAITSAATTTWNGDLATGSGRVALDSSGAAELPVNWKARSEGSTTTTTPEELLGAAHSACFSMALSHALTGNGTPPTSLHTEAKVDFQPGVGISRSHLTVTAVVPGIADADFLRLATEAKEGCPVSQALAGIEISLDASLSGE